MVVGIICLKKGAGHAWRWAVYNRSKMREASKTNRMKIVQKYEIREYVDQV